MAPVLLQRFCQGSQDKSRPNKAAPGEKYHDADEVLEKLTMMSQTAISAMGVWAEVMSVYTSRHWTRLEQVALEYFATAKSLFISGVKSKVEKRIARRVVIALNRAKRAIERGKERVTEAYNELSPKEKEEVDGVYNAVKDRFGELEKTVDERQHEIIQDMARTYNNSVGKLKATFDKIKKDVQTGWLEKAWNKIKAVVNAIIEFATQSPSYSGK